MAAVHRLESDHPIDQSIVESFQRNGHAIVRQLASPDEVKTCRPTIARVVREVAQRQDPQGRIDDYSKLFTQVTNIWRIDDAAREIVFSRRFAGVAARLLGVPSVRLYHDQALFKPSGADRTPWHQDRYYWPLDTEMNVTMWMPLVDVDEQMGPIMFASGSHRADGIGDVPISGETDRRLAAMIRERGWPVWSAPLSAGDATFHAGATVHSAGANRSDRTREVLTVIYYAADARVAEPANENQRVDLEVFLPGVHPGAPASSPLNPILYP